MTILTLGWRRCGSTSDRCWTRIRRRPAMPGRFPICPAAWVPFVPRQNQCRQDTVLCNTTTLHRNPVQYRSFEHLLFPMCLFTINKDLTVEISHQKLERWERICSDHLGGNTWHRWPRQTNQRLPLVPPQRVPHEHYCLPFHLFQKLEPVEPGQTQNCTTIKA